MQILHRTRFLMSSMCVWKVCSSGWPRASAAMLAGCEGLDVIRREAKEVMPMNDYQMDKERIARLSDGLRC
jgi:hypothetical protein